MHISNLLPRAFARLGVHYGWAVVAVTFLTMLSTSAVMGMVGVLMLPLKSEFGWDLGAISGAQTFTAGLAALQEKSESSVAVIGYTGSVAIAHVVLTTWGTVMCDSSTTRSQSGGK